ncbi:MAG: phosphoribosylformylglycinamidine cyclo-ligase [Coriobacteriia bacterium]|nr:phosphoribosylformylglycinamidine cyclo-ligase [Coriobacteriia bacterium]
MADKEAEMITYKAAGVDTAEGERAVNAIKESVRSTYRPEVIGGIGGFAGLFSAAAFKEMDDPVLVSGTDGVGTKIRVAQLLGKHDTVGVDLVAMCANDVLVVGAEPLFFLDYIAIGKLDSDLVGTIVSGIAEGCRQAGCALIGGEMAEHPGVMAERDYDLSGFCVGVAERSKMVDGSSVVPGDIVLGLASSGVHSNGFSLVRKAVVEVDGAESALALPRLALGGRSLGEALLEPTRIYVKSVLGLMHSGGTGGMAPGEATGGEGTGGAMPIKAMAHITGGGITENLNRALPEDCDARVRRGSWPVPRVIETVVEAASLTPDEAYKTFNMGIGFALILDPAAAPVAAASLRAAGEKVFEIGEIVKGSGKVVYA